MNRTDVPSARLAEELFDEMLIPLAGLRAASEAQPYFPVGPDPAVTSYFTKPRVSTMAPADFEIPNGGAAEGVIDALASLWTAQGEAGLATLAPRLKEIAGALRDENSEADGEVDILCYTLF